MSTPIKDNPPTYPSSTKKIACKTYLDFNVKIYREVGNHIVYYLSKVSRSSVDSLVDRGANGSLAGNDVMSIAKYSDRTVDVRGADKHEIESIHSLTAGGVALTTSGEACAST